MAREMAKTRRVLYVNHPYSLKDFISGLRQKDPALRRRWWRICTFRSAEETLDSIPERFVAVTPPLTLPVNWLPPGMLYRFFHRLNNWVVLRAIRQAARRHGFHNFLYINCYDPFYAGVLPPGSGASACIYHCIDDISQDAYTARHGLQLENEACRAADITLVTSSNLYRLKAPIARRTELYVNAADVSVFSQVLERDFPKPDILQGRSGRVIGFIGNLDALRIDYPLLKKTAQQFPDDTLLLVGPVNSSEPAAIGLDRWPNVVFAGARALHDLPPLLAHMDVVLIPFLCNTLTFSIYPLKINEYLAAGKPVVSTAFSDDIRSFSDCAYLAENHDAFLRSIDAAFQENDPDLQRQRSERAAANTWAARIRQLDEMANRTN